MGDDGSEEESREKEEAKNRLMSREEQEEVDEPIESESCARRAGIQLFMLFHKVRLSKAAIDRNDRLLLALFALFSLYMEAA